MLGSSQFLERFHVDPGIIIISEKGPYICQQEIARNHGSKSILVKIVCSHYREHNKWNIDPDEIHTYTKTLLGELFSKKTK